MKSRFINACLITATIAALFFSGLLNQNAEAQKQKALGWYKVADTDRKTKPNRVYNRPLQKKEPLALLTLKYQVLKRGDGNTSRMTDPEQELAIGDQIKLAVTPNQDGYLYVIHHSADTAGQIIDKPRVIFPDPRINNGENKVSKDKRYVVPGYCQDFADPNDCWWEITPPNGREYFTVVFTRDQIKDLPNRLTTDDIMNSANAVSEQLVKELKDSSGQTIARSTEAEIGARRTIESDGVYVQNTNRKDNEELVETIVLKHLAGRDDDPSARARALVVKQRANGMRLIVLKDNVEVDPSREFKSGDEIKVKFQSNFAGYVYVVNVTPGGKKHLMFPCSRSMANEVRPGQWNVLPTGDYVISFDTEKGIEILQVIMSREKIGYLQAAINECCDPSKQCEIGATASDAAAELQARSNQRQGGLAADNVVAALPQSESSGIRARGITLSAGKDRSKDGSFVAVSGPGTLEPGQIAVFELRLKHN